MDLTTDILRRAKRQNLFRLARAMGLHKPANTTTGDLIRCISTRSIVLRLKDEWAREAEKKHV